MVYIGTPETESEKRANEVKKKYIINCTSGKGSASATHHRNERTERMKTKKKD